MGIAWSPRGGARILRFGHPIFWLVGLTLGLSRRMVPYVGSLGVYVEMHRG